MDPQLPSSLVERYSVATVSHITLDLGPHYILWLNPKCHCGVAASFTLHDRTPDHSGIRRRWICICQIETRSHWHECLPRVTSGAALMASAHRIVQSSRGQE